MQIKKKDTWTIAIERPTAAINNSFKWSAKIPTHYYYWRKLRNTSDWKKLEVKKLIPKKNINQLMSEELLSNDRRVEKKIGPTGHQTISLSIHNQTLCPLGYETLTIDMPKQFYISNMIYFGVRAIEITQKWRAKEWKRHLRSQRMF